MDSEQYLLGKLAEEAAEIAQIALKTQQFGFTSRDPTCESLRTNRDLLVSEINDLLAVVMMLDATIIPQIVVGNPDQVRKMNKVRKYQGVARDLGRVS